MCQVPPSAFHRLAEHQAQEMIQEWKTKILGRGFSHGMENKDPWTRMFPDLVRAAGKRQLVRVTVSTNKFKSAAPIHLLGCLDAKLN